MYRPHLFSALDYCAFIYSFIMNSSISVICPVHLFVGHQWRSLYWTFSDLCSLVNSSWISPPFSIVPPPPIFQLSFNTWLSFSPHLPTNISFTSVCSPRLRRSNPWSLQIQDLTISKPYDILRPCQCCLPAVFWLKYCFCLKDQKLILVSEILIFD